MCLLAVVIGDWWKAAGPRSCEKVIGKGFVAYRESPWQERAVLPRWKGAGHMGALLAQKSLGSEAALTT